MGGEIVLGSTGGGAIAGALGVAPSMLQAINPFKTLFSAFGNLLKCLFTAFKPKNFIRLLLALFMALIWVAPIAFPNSGINPENSPWLSWLTFAQGGLQSGAAGFIGDLFGKGITAGVVIGLLTSPINTIKSFGGGFGKMFSSPGFKQPGPMLLGMGIALIGYNFMAGAATPGGTMASIAALIVTLKALGSRAGFLRNLLGGFFAKNKRVNAAHVNTCMAGIATGFALSVPLSAMQWHYAPYIIGAILAVVGLILAIASGNKQEVAAA
jgi:hypothetical protein